MDFDEIVQNISDTRAFSNSGNKNYLFSLAEKILNSVDVHEKEQMTRLLINEIEQMLRQNNYMLFSVALSLSSSPQHYRLLWSALDKVLNAQSEHEIQWMVWPLVIIQDSQTFVIKEKNAPPLEIISQFFKNHHSLKEFNSLSWLPHFLSSEDFSSITADMWFRHKGHETSAQSLFSALSHQKHEMMLKEKVSVIYLLSWAPFKNKELLMQEMNDLSLPLMQLWQEYFNTLSPKTSIFVNPLKPFSPAWAILEAHLIQRRMKFDFFVSGSIRKIRLNNLEPKIVIATREGGDIETLIFTEGALTHNQFLNSNFFWQLTFADDISQIIRDMLQFLKDCQVKAVKVLKQPLAINDDILDFCTLGDEAYLEFIEV